MLWPGIAVLMVVVLFNPLQQRVTIGTIGKEGGLGVYVGVRLVVFIICLSVYIVCCACFLVAFDVFAYYLES